MVVKQGYKQTDIGIFPEDWHIYRYADIGQVIDGDRGHHYPSKDELKNDGFCLFLNAGNVTRFGFRFDHCEFISRTKNNALSKGKLARNDIVLTTRGTLGNFAVYLDDIKFEHIRINSGMVILRNRSESNSIRFQYEMLRSHVLRHQIERISFGSAQPQLTVGGINDLLIPLPRTLAEQETIAGALSDADAWIESLDQLIAKKRQIKQGTMQELLTGKRRLPGFSGRWQEATLGEICTKIQDGTHFSPKLGGSDYLYLTSKNIRFGVLDLSTAERISANEHAKIYSRCDVRKGDLLLTKDGANTGNAAINTLEEPFSLLSSVALVRFDERVFCTRFFLYQLLSKDGQQQIKELMSGNAITRLTLQKIRTIECYYPQIQEQTAIATVLSDMDTEIESLESKLAKAREIKQGMMQELLTGKIRLIEN
jgi:type I restriction enzyme S subunit